MGNQGKLPIGKPFQCSEYANTAFPKCNLPWFPMYPLILINTSYGTVLGSSDSKVPKQSCRQFPQPVSFFTAVSVQFQRVYFPYIHRLVVAVRTALWNWFQVLMNIIESGIVRRMLYRDISARLTQLERTRTLRTLRTNNSRNIFFSVL